MIDEEYGYLVASHGDAAPPRDQIRRHDNQVPTLDSLPRVITEMGVDKEVRIATELYCRSMPKAWAAFSPPGA
ncbi:MULTISPECIES: hypothetical protein [unclassified Sinorhizobium]|uniref:hypothetical protein n=1 Tax=unclassified Sinorhizobium TaxID=2613772 RepID=UPI0024C3A193|nr:MULTISPECIES: hypothetical protein [unclassified Sinorhizobium]MDK1376829.1 hypothetical protein [Sinorhizobium sp. 6-70]MDK1481070.1 hypothetical protein [Sinorhizobium sp. 6-117]